MLSMSTVRKLTLAPILAAALIATGAPASAQDNPNQGAVSITGSFDVLNQYMFRGIRQNSSGVATWPALDLGFAAYEGDGGVKSLGINLGTWNSLHSGDTGSDGPSGRMWYESDFYASVGFGFGGGTSVGVTYTAYTSPNSSFTTVKEVAFRLGLDDSEYLGTAALSPYVVVAQEFGTEPGTGQADGGDSAGTYLEVGVAPGYSTDAIGVSFPIKAGFSLGDYYELGGEDNKFGFFSIAASVTVPLGPTSNFGSWSLRGGVEYQRLGATTEVFNGGESNQVIGSVGIAFSY